MRATTNRLWLVKSGPLDPVYVLADGMYDAIGKWQEYIHNEHGIDERKGVVMPASVELIAQSHQIVL